jgi:PAS domain S-box-containing protein
MATILVVDDRPTNRELLVTLLGYAGHHVLEAAEGEAGLAIARTEHPDLIITDIVMPMMDGYEFARQVRADPTIRETQIIFHTSSYIVAETRRLAEACGVHIVLTKPIEPEKLFNTIQTSLASKPKPVAPFTSTSDDFHREHMRLLTDTLAKKIDELEAENAERKKAEERFRLVVEAAPNVILLVNRQGRIEMVNSQAEKFFGYDRAELIGLEVDRLVPEPFRGIHARHRQNYLEDLESRPMGAGRDLYALRKDGSEFPVEIGLTPIETQEGLLTIATIVDITERKRAEEAVHAKNEELKAMSQQLWQAAKLATMGELAASVAHELNNPLAIVSLRAEMLQSQFTPEDPQSKSLLIIAAEVKRMSSLVMNLLQFSRRSASQISTINVNEEVADTLELVQYHLRKNNILTVQELSPEIPLVPADRQQLRQVFLNLFTNAADAMPLGGMLIIRTWSGEKPDEGITAPLQRSTTKSLGLPAPDQPQVFIEVSDSGEGIAPEKLDSVWEVFYTTKPEGKGTGLGLAICRRIIQEHGGTIEIFSEGIPGKGTTVRLSLPAVKER